MLRRPRRPFPFGDEVLVLEAAAVDRCHPRHPRATLLDIMGPDHGRHAFFHGGPEDTLTGVVCGPIA